MTRWRAATIHLGLSALIIGSVFLLVLAQWYPPALLPMSGIVGLIVLIAIVDVCLGPLLTLIVYRHDKPSLKFDLAVIVALQLGMLGYGFHVLAQNRPVFMVGTSDRLTLIRAFEIEAGDLAAAKPEYQRLSWTGPVWVGARAPDDPEQRNQLLFESMAGRDLFRQPRYYLEFDLIRAELLTQSRRVSDLLDHLSPAEQRHLESVSSPTGLTNLRYLVIHSSRGSAMLLVDSAGKMGQAIAIDPYQVLARPERSASLSAAAATGASFCKLDDHRTRWRNAIAARAASAAQAPAPTT